MKRHLMALLASTVVLGVAPSGALALEEVECGAAKHVAVSQTQCATNENETNQTASSEATSEQKNVNVPISVLSADSNNGNVDQSNRGHTTSSAQNNNGTGQSNRQYQKGSA